MAKQPEQVKETIIAQVQVELQDAINVYMDSSKAMKLSEKAVNGLRQVLEKKEGLFRKNMMGKRVNFCARSVISPDPYIDSNEVGIPITFAKILTVEEYVKPGNVKKLS
jgi:DNA-directed RNA polymerase I subunit RPA1